MQTLKTKSIRPQDNVFVFYSDRINFKSVTENGVEHYYVEGHITTGDLDLVNDIVTKAGMDDMEGQLESRTIKIDYEHEAFIGKSRIEREAAKTKMPLGKIIKKNRDSKGIFVKAELNPNWKMINSKGIVIRTFEEVWASIKAGFVDAFSIAFIPTKSVKKEVKGIMTRFLDGVNLLNVALTGNAINTGASMTNVFAKSLKYMEQVEGKNPISGEYEDDGAHAHTDNDPLGEHRHPDLEAAMKEMHRNIMDRLDRISDRLFELENPAESDGLKGKPYPVKKEKKRGGHMTEEKKNDAPAPEGDGANPEKPPVEPADAGKEGGDAGGEAQPEGGADPEKKSNEDLVEVKAQLEKLSTDLKAKDKEIQDLKAIVEKARPKALGAEAKGSGEGGEVPTAQPETKSVGPLDAI